MTSTTKTVLIVAGSAVGLYVVYKLVSSPTGLLAPKAGALPGNNILGTIISGLSTPTPANGPRPVTPGASGGGATPVSPAGYVDPTTGLYYATSGSVGVPYQPAAYPSSQPGSDSFTPYAPGASAPGPYAPVIVDTSTDSIWASGV